MRRRATSSPTGWHTGRGSRSRWWRDEIRKAAVERKTEVSLRSLPSFGQVKPAERGLIWALVNQAGRRRRRDGRARFRPTSTCWPPPGAGHRACPGPGGRRPFTLGPAGASKYGGGPVVTRMAAEPTPGASPADCVRALKRLRFGTGRGGHPSARFDQLQETGTAATLGDIDRLWQQKRAILQRIEALGGCSAPSGRRRPLSIEDKYDEVRQLITIGQGEGIPACTTRSTSCCARTSPRRMTSTICSARLAVPASRSWIPSRSTARTSRAKGGDDLELDLTAGRAGQDERSRCGCTCARWAPSRS